MISSKKMFVLTEAVLAVLVVMTAIAMLRGKSGEKPVSYTHLTLPTK